MDNLEKEMIDVVNHHAKKTTIPTSNVAAKKNASTLKRGLKRMAVALFTAVLFGLSVYAFIATATATGYWAIVLFFCAIILLSWAFAFLYAQGVTDDESQGDVEC